MTKKLKFSVLCIALAILAISSAALLMLNKTNSFANEEKALAVESQILTQYKIGDTLTIPEATLTYSGGSVKADKHKLITPNGKVYSGSVVVLDQFGEYALTYLKTVGDTLVTGEKKFNVLNSAFSVGAASSVSYGRNEKLADSENLKAVNGLNVKLAAGETFYCNTPIDLRGTTMNDNLITFFSLPNEIGKPDANEIYVRLTDAYDADNYITIKSGHVDYPDVVMGDLRFGRSYQCVAAANQPYTGIRVASSSTVQYEGDYYIVEVGGAAGYKSLFSPSAYLGYGEERGAFKLSMNYGERVVYGSDKYNLSSGGTVIADLDNTLFFTNLWEGFTTGECFLSIYAGSYTTSHMEFMITNIKDCALGESNTENGGAPKISIQEEKGAYAIVGRPFKVYPATATEVYSGIINCDVEVMFNGSVSVPVVNGEFIPTKEGDYSIKYTAQSKNGQVTEEKITVIAMQQSDVTIDYAVQQNLKAGEPVIFDNESITGTSGAYTLKMSAQLKDNKVPAYDITGDNGVYSFCPLYAGEYDVIYTITDYVGVTEMKNTIKVDVGSCILKDTPNLPEYFIMNESYAIPKMNCYELSSGKPVEQSTQVLYSFDSDKEQTEVGADKIKITAKNKVTIIYKYQENQIAKFVIPVVDVGYGSMQMKIYKYFNSKNGSMAFNAQNSNESYSAYTVNGENASMEFIKEIAVSSFGLSFSVPTCNFDRLSVALANNAQALTIDLVKLGETQSKVIVNGMEYTIGKNFTKGGNFTVNYVNSTKSVTIVGEGTPYTFILPNEVFEGFKQNTARLTITANDYQNTQQSIICISKLNNQFIVGVEKDDYTAPEIYHNVASGIKRLNDVISLAGIGATDVLYESTVCTYSVYGPSGLATSAEGKKLKDIQAGENYTLKLSEYGNYRIVITAVDGIGNEVKNTVNLNVVDDIAPTIKLDGETVYKYLNSKLELKEYTVSDNLDDADNIRVKVMLLSPNGVSYNDLDEFVLNEVGNYTVVVYAIDSTNNISQANYTITVVEEVA